MEKFSFIDLQIMVNNTKDQLISHQHETLLGMYENTIKSKLRAANRMIQWQKKQK